MMAWIVASVLGVLLIVASVLIVLLVVSPGFRTWCFGVVCGLGVVGLLLFISQQHTPQEQARERHASARSRDAAPGVGKEATVRWEQRSGQSGAQAAPTAQAWLEAVSTPAEAAQAVQRLRTAQDVLRQGQEEHPARAMPQAAVRPPPETSAPPPATPVPAPTRPSVLAAEANDALALAGPPTEPATPSLRATLMPPSSIPPRAPLTPLPVPTPSAPTSGSALKACDELQAEIRAKLDARSLTGYTLTIMPSGDLQGLQVVGSCEGNTKKIVLTRSRNAP